MIDLIYNLAVVMCSLLLFFMKFTAPNAVFELILKALGKIIPLFCMLYASIEVFKYFGVLN
jgi:hypothetical protein